MRLSKRALAEKLQTSERSLTSWQREGMPVLEHGRRGRENAYDLAAVLDWICTTRDPARIRVNIAALQRELGIGARSPAIDSRTIARAIAQATVVFFEELHPEDFDVAPAELAEALNIFSYTLTEQLAAVGIAGVGEILDSVSSEVAYPTALEDIIARVRAEVPPL